MQDYTRRPEWLRLRPLHGGLLEPMRKLTAQLNLHTVCESALCPNRMDCFTKNTATFMILGDTCTRNCTFCAVKHGRPNAPDLLEPQNIVEAVRVLGLRYVVITSVTRDDLPDGGASQFARVVDALRSYDSAVLVETLIPDFQGSLEALKRVICASPAVLNHNVETVPRLYPEVRPQAKYERSLDLLARAKSLHVSLLTKSGLMVGLGETRQEVIDTMSDLRKVGCDSITIGQYLPPSLRHHPVVKYVSPEEFEEYGSMARAIGFAAVNSAPLVRSSFHASKGYLSLTSPQHSSGKCT